MPRGKPTIIVPIRMEPEMKDMADKQAATDGETLSDLVRDGVRRELKARRRRNVPSES